MKQAILILFCLQVIYGIAISQCPHPGLNIQTSFCDPPQGLAANILSCKQAEAKWVGNQNQTYILSAYCFDSVTNTKTNAQAGSINQYNKDSFSATIDVKGGTKLTWLLQPVCKDENAVFYGEEVYGPEVYIPACLEIKQQNEVRAINVKSRVKIFPNPSPGSLIIDLAGKDKIDNINIRILDAAGKVVYVERNKKLGNTRMVQLNLRGLTNGLYLLELNDGKLTEIFKFELARN